MNSSGNENKTKKKSQGTFLSQVAPSWLYVYISSHHFPLSHEMLFVCVYCTCVVKGILPVTSIGLFFFFPSTFVKGEGLGEVAVGSQYGATNTTTKILCTMEAYRIF